MCNIMCKCFRSGLGDGFIGLTFCMEASTPFLCLKQFLNVLDMNQNSVQRINNFCLILVYFLVRICVIPYVYLVYAFQNEVTLKDVILIVPLKCHVGSLMLFSFQMYWFCRIVKNTSWSTRKKKNSTRWWHLNSFLLFP
jgi:hypothetical protein